MMTSRRGALVALAIGASGGAPQTAFNAFGAEVMDTTSDRLQADIDRLAGRVYSEEGIPMFLACENLAADHNSPPPAAAALNKDLATAFHRDAEAWQRIHPEAPVTDIPKIIEMLADRDFANGGAEGKL